MTHLHRLPAAGGRVEFRTPLHVGGVVMTRPHEEEEDDEHDRPHGQKAEEVAVLFPGMQIVGAHPHNRWCHFRGWPHNSGDSFDRSLASEIEIKPHKIGGSCNVRAS
jgi:hypothetical protein